MKKYAYAVQMSYNVTDDEKRQAERALIFFNHADKLLSLASDYLNNIKTPFKDNPQMEPNDVMKIRAALRRFRDTGVDHFNDFKKTAFKCVQIMQSFSSDTQIIKLMKSFISSIDQLELEVNEFVKLFDDLKSKDFSTKVVSLVERIQNQSEEISKIIDERIKKYIQSNILASNWVDSVSNELQIKIQKKKPYIVDLFNKRQEQLNEALQDRVIKQT